MSNSKADENNKDEKPRARRRTSAGSRRAPTKASKGSKTSKSGRASKAAKSTKANADKTSKPKSRASKKSASKSPKKRSETRKSAPKKSSSQSTSASKKTVASVGEESPETSVTKSSTQSSRSSAVVHTSRARRAVLVAGVRTPFVRAFGKFAELSTIDLGVHATRALLERSGVREKDIDSIVWGGVLLPPMAPNVGREIALDLGLPPSIEAHTVTRACASGLQAVTTAVSMIERGDADVVIAGGSDSTTNAAVAFPPKAVRALAPITMGKASGIGDYLTAFSKLRPLGEVIPRMPKIAERSTGEKMGEAADRMARIHNVSRAEQDAFALLSHERAAAAQKSGRFDDEVAPLMAGTLRVEVDDITRHNSSLEKLAKLRPAFSSSGTVTAGNASPLTDGAAATMWMSEERAEALGLTPIATIRHWSYVGVDPRDQLLIGPALAMPKALHKAGLTRQDIDLFDIHEAFAAQVLSVVSALQDAEFLKARLGDEILGGKAFGEITSEDLNVHGGSISIGHPFAATGARMVTTMANELHRTGKNTALLGICAAGGLGAAAVIERV